MKIAGRLQELQRRFLVGLEGRVSDLTAEVNAAADPKALMRMFHSLAGIGGTYGFPRITELSRPCEALCTSAIEGSRPFTLAEREQLSRAIIEIRASAPSSGAGSIAA